jgi:hypothetical protein
MGLGLKVMAFGAVSKWADPEGMKAGQVLWDWRDLIAMVMAAEKASKSQGWGQMGLMLGMGLWDQRGSPRYHPRQDFRPLESRLHKEAVQSQTRTQALVRLPARRLLPPMARTHLPSASNGERRVNLA